MLIFSTAHSPRLQYMVDLISRELCITDATITSDREVFSLYEGVRINYSEKPVTQAEFHIVPVSLLFESDLRSQQTECFSWYGMKAFFASPGNDLPFDIFAAIFFLVSRYEEYLPFEPDRFGCFPHTASIAGREGFLQEPLVNNWLMQLEVLLKKKFPAAIFRRKNFTFIPTYDIDMMYAYRYKGLKRNTGGFFRSILRKEYSSAFQRLNVLRGEEKDPYDAYEWLDALHLYCRVNPVYFFLVAQQQKGYDRNIPTDTRPFQELIHYYAATHKVGLHPSWQSSTAATDEIMKEEKEWMEAVADLSITKSRQHYIKLNLPGTYERLYRCGIRQDFSMGYGSINGFRASMASSYYWFNLATNSATDLMLYPFCFMDANSYYEQKHTPQQAYTELMRFYAAVKKVRGCFITIWHNNFLGSDPMYREWKDLYEIFMKEDAYWDAG